MAWTIVSADLRAARHVVILRSRELEVTIVAFKCLGIAVRFRISLLSGRPDSVSHKDLYYLMLTRGACRVTFGSPSDSSRWVNRSFGVRFVVMC